LRTSIPATQRLAYAAAYPSGGARGKALMICLDAMRHYRHCRLLLGGYALHLSGCDRILRRSVTGRHFFEVPVMSLTEARFHDLVDATQQALEDIFDESDLDLDLENSAGVLTVKFEDGTQLIFSRQEPLRQLWLAARSGGFHFDYDEEHKRWVCDSSDELLSEMLARITLEQAGVELEFDEI
jgi:CyaY protein